MAEPSKEQQLERLREKGLLADDEVREARRLLDEAERDGRALALPEALLRAGALAAKAHHVAVALESGDAAALEADEVAAPEIRSSGLQMIERIGRGSQAVVYKCRQVDMDRVVAVKVLLPSASGDAESRARFIQEARSAGRLSHPNVVTVHEIRPLKDMFCIVMEYVDGGSLSDLLRLRNRFDPAEAVLIVRQVAEGLRAAHARGLIHRDIKPRNILLTSEGVVKLADMGLARRAAEADETDGKASGTPYYISPEQVTGDPPVDYRTDIYSLGATLYEMVAGRPPFMAPTPHEVMRMHVVAPLPDPREYVPDLPQSLCGLIAKMMAREPEDRYQSAEELLSAMGQLDLSVLGMAAGPRQLIEQVGEAAAAERRKARRAKVLTRAAATRRGAPAGPDDAGEEAAPRRAGSGKGLLVGLIVFFLVAAAGTAVVLFLYGPRLFGDRSAGPPPGPASPTQGPVDLSQAEKSAQVALDGAKALERMPSAAARDVIEAYQNVVKFYPGTRAAAEAQQSASRVRAVEGMQLPPAVKPPPAKPVSAAPQPVPPQTPKSVTPAATPPEPKPPEPKPPEPKPPEPITVKARDATIHGDGARYEEGPERDNIGFWNKADTWVSWDVVAEAGTYAVEVTYALDPGQGGGEIRVSVGEESLNHTVQDTGGWGRFVTRRLGTVRVPRAGAVTIAVRPVRVERHGVVNLQAVGLVPPP